MKSSSSLYPLPDTAELEHAPTRALGPGAGLSLSLRALPWSQGRVVAIIDALEFLSKALVDSGARRASEQTSCRGSSSLVTPTS